MRLKVLLCCLIVGVLIVVAHVRGRAQERTATGKPDPRVGLKAGLRDAGEAARGLERVASLSNPTGFFDPKVPAGEATPPERDPKLPPPDPDAPPDPRYANLLAFGNSDLAFGNNHLFMGSFHGFNTYDVENGRNPKLLGSVVCPGGQGDMSVHGNLLFMSVEQTRGRLDCGTGGVPEKISVERFRGVRIFDISDIKKPRQVAAIQTCRGSHTHTLVTDPNDKANIYVYGSGTSSVRSAEELAGCSGLKPDEDPNTALFSIDVIKVPLAKPETAAIVNRPRIFADTKTGAISRPVGRRRSRCRHAEDLGDQSVPRHHGVPGDRSCRRRVLGQRHPARHPRSRASGAPGRRERQELRVLAFGDFQQ